MSQAYRFLLIGAIAWGVFSFGAVYPWGYWPLAGAMALLGIWALLATRGWIDRRVRQLTAACSAVLLAIALQIVPLPREVVHAVSPARDLFFQQSQIGFNPARFEWTSLSINPDATVVVFLFLAACALLVLGLVRGIRYVGEEWLVTQLMGLGVALAVVGVLQRTMAGGTPALVYGFWRPLDGGSPFGPFINRNHFAGWMVMTIPVVLGYSCALVATSRRPARARWTEWMRWGTTVDANRVALVWFAVLAMGMSVVLTGSRSGMIGVGVGLTVVAASVARRSTSRRARLLVGASPLVILLLAAAWAGLDRALGRFGPASQDFSVRLEHWRETWLIVRAFPWTGIGLGAYEQVMLVYQHVHRELMYAQAHNDYLQLLAEGGLLVTVPLAATGVVITRTAIRRFSSDEDTVLAQWLRVGALGGIAGIAIQSCVEFSLQIPANATLLMVLVGLLIHRPNRLSRHAYRV